MLNDFNVLAVRFALAHGLHTGFCAHSKRSDLKYFEKLYGAAVIEDAIRTHLPLERDIHGHMHANSVGDERYINVPAEQINLTPIASEELRL